MGTETATHWTILAPPDLREELARVTVVVLYGGTSSEREVSLVSGRAMLAALEQAGGERAAARAVGVEIDAEGLWCVAGSALAPERALAALPADSVFLLGVHGGAGENGTLQGFLELAGRRYTGSGVLASALCMDKHLARLAFAAAGLRVADGGIVHWFDWRADAERCLSDLAALGAGPWYVKPNRGGSSVLTFRAGDVDALRSAVGEVAALESDVLVERAVSGVEVTCGVVGNRVGAETALPLVEIRPREGHFFDYEEKYSESGALELCPPETLSDGSVGRVQACALHAYRVAGCAGYARVDFIVPEDGGEPVILEINTLPGFTPTSLLPKEAAATGVGFRELCLELCALAIERFRQEQR